MERSNEELVLLIQSGQREYIPQLWRQVSDFIRYMADRHLKNYQDYCQQFHGDMVNQSYFYFLNAIEGYQEGKGKFTSYLSFHIRNAFNEVLQGRTHKTKNEPLNVALSLDLPVNDTEELTLADMLIDAESEGYYRRIEDMEFWKSVNAMLHDAVDTLPEEWQPFFCTMLEHGSKLTETLRILRIDLKEKSRYRAIEEKGRRQIRRYIDRHLAKQKDKDPALEECISYYTGVKAWRNRGFTSVVEEAVIKRNDPRYTTQAISEVLILSEPTTSTAREAPK